MALSSFYSGLLNIGKKMTECLCLPLLFFHRPPERSSAFTSDLNIIYNRMSSSSLSSPSVWDVFLSFYGKDTRNTFTSHLYSALDQASIKTYRDDPELQKGEHISSELLQAIQESKASIVVLSQNYALSTWCLDELVEILVCSRTNGLLVIPVFYHVDPSDIRHQKGSFEKALKIHKKHHPVNKIDKWRAALTEIADLSGYHLGKDQEVNESDTVQQIVTDVAPQVSTKALSIAGPLVGIDFVLEDISDKLGTQQNDVRAIGICGMGGIGKTTIAKAFYNKFYHKFQVSCFLEEVNKKFQEPDDLSLLERLLVQLTREKNYKVTDAESGKRKLKEILSSKKALLVIDNLSKSSFLDELIRDRNSYVTGSRIIITTRDEYLINRLRIEIYKVMKLGKEESLKLFGYHAFRSPFEDLEAEDIIKLPLGLDFVDYADGLPLALEVLGASLFARPLSFWMDKLEKVKKIPEKKIQEILKLSYDELSDRTEKDTFLDIVFFFVGEDKDEAVDVFHSCEFFPNVAIPILVERHLLTIDEDNKFRMHNLIIDMGNEVIREESKMPDKSARLICQGNAFESLTEGTDKIVGLILDLTTWRQKQSSVGILSNLTKLRLLKITSAPPDFKVIFKKSFEELRCIHWKCCPWKYLPSNFWAQAQKLVLLDMQFSNLKQLWEGPMHCAGLKSIKVDGSEFLETTPNFSNVKLLEKLSLGYCRDLLEVDESIVYLSKLSHLDLSGCQNLKQLPEPIGELHRLSHLGLRNCNSLSRLPNSINQLTRLRHLDLHDCSNVTRLPEQLGGMKCLKILDASSTAIDELPDSICHLRQLDHLNLAGCKTLGKLPEQLGDIKSLKMLDASSTAIEQLPDSICQLRNLDHLNLAHCKRLKELSEQLGDMKNLKILDANDTVIQQLPDSICQLRHLDVLNLFGCGKLRKLPEQIGNMEGLRTFNASFTAVAQVPDTICQLRKLNILDLAGCKRLARLPDQIGNMEGLRRFRANHSAVEQLPDSFESLINLVELELDSCKNLRYLPNNIWKLSFLELLDLKDCSNMESLPEQLGKMQSLTKLDASCTAIEELPDSIGQLSRLRSLDLIGCKKIKKLPAGIWGLTTIENLHLWQSDSLKILPDSVKYMEKVEKLSLRCVISSCLPMISSFSSLTHLMLVDVGKSFYSTKPLSLSKLYRLQYLTLVDCTSLGSSLPELPLNLEFLCVEGYVSLVHLPDLSSLIQLSTLWIRKCSSLQSLSLLPSHLANLQIGDCTSLRDTRTITTLKELGYLYITKCSNLKFNVEERFFQVLTSPFQAVVPMGEIPNWFSNKSRGCKVSCEVPNIFSADNFLGIVLCIFYECQSSTRFSIRAVITNETNGAKQDYVVDKFSVGGVGSVLACIYGDQNLVTYSSGDRINVSFELRPSWNGEDMKSSNRDMKVESCGVHLMYKPISASTSSTTTRGVNKASPAQLYETIKRRMDELHRLMQHHKRLAELYGVQLQLSRIKDEDDITMGDDQDQ